MQKLNFPDANLKIKLVEGSMQIFDQVRKKYFILTPEEWVRQHVIYYLNRIKKYPISLMAVEKMIQYNHLKTRADIVVYNNRGKANMIVECKSPNVKITQDTFNQIAKYNYNVKVKLLFVTNGINHFCCNMDYTNNKIDFLAEIPSF